MEFQSTVLPEDWGAFVRLIQKRRRPWWGWIVFPGLLLGLPWLFNLLLRKEYLSLLLGACLGMTATVIYSQLLARRWLPARGGNVLGARTMRVDERGIFVIRPVMETLYRWDCLQSAVQTPQLLVLFVDNNAGILIPRRDLHPEQFQELLELIHTHAPAVASDLP